MAGGTTQYKLANPEVEPTPPDGTILHFVPDADSEHFAEFSQDCSYYLPLLRWHDETQQLAEVGVGTIRTNVPVMITYIGAIAAYVLGGMPANKDLNEWHEYAAPQDIGPGSAKYHYRPFGLNIDVDFTEAPRHDAVSVIHNGSANGTVTVKFGTTLSGVRAIKKNAQVLKDLVIPPGGLLHMVGTEDNWWRLVTFTSDGTEGGGIVGPKGDDGGTVYTFTAIDYEPTNPSEVVCVDSTVGPITITLPPLPEANNYVGVWDVGDNAATNNITILQNGNTIFDRNEEVLIDMDGGRFDFIWNDNP